MSYRREDTAYPAGWLYERLVAHLGRDQVFKDVDSIELGDKFPEVIANAVGSCDVLLALIGNRWLTAKDEDGKRRIDKPDDFVRLEIEAALQRDVRVIPILVEGARMPHADALPTSLGGVVQRQALELSPSRFDADATRLLRVLDKTLGETQAPAEAGRQVRQENPIERQSIRSPASRASFAGPSRRWVVSIIAVAAIVVASALIVRQGQGGTGAESNSTGISKAEYIARADSICAGVGPKLDSIPSSDDRTTTAQKTEAIFRKMYADLRALPMPSGEEARLNQVWGALGAMVHRYEDYALALTVNDANRADRAHEQWVQAAVKAGDLAKSYGFGDCGSRS